MHFSQERVMTTSFTRISSFAMLAAAMMLGACDSLDSITKPAAAVATPGGAATAAGAAAAPEQPAQPSALADGIALYNKGSYSAAVKRLANAPEIWSADVATQTEALKYMAFSYCVTARKKLCRQQFDKALKLDAGFDLAAGEKGHPLWGPVFNQAKKAAATTAKK